MAMQEAAKILFETLHNGKPLFSSQLDLVTALLNDPDNVFYVSDKELDKYTKAQTRLKTYVSQLLSATVSRSITEDFKTSLTTAIAARLPGNTDVPQMVDMILTAIRQKNSGIVKTEVKTSFLEQFTSDLDNAHYVAVITARPLEIEAPERPGSPTLRNFLFTDLIARLYNKEKDLKSYRFNFPNESFGYLFWRGLKRILFRQFKANPSPELFDSLYQKFAIENNPLTAANEQQKLTDDQLDNIVNETLLKLNTNRFILVFTTTAPVYGLPLVAFDPSDTKNNKVYAILEGEKMNLYKFPDSETLLWRLFMWDPLKSKKYAGQQIYYSSDAV